MVRVDQNKCTSCGICIRQFKGYCISEKDKMPLINYDLCNQCQKCISICPARAILINDIAPDKIECPVNITPEDFEELFARRRSIKKFKDQKIRDDIIQRIVHVASYAPNQNKNINLLVIDDPAKIKFVDDRALNMIKLWYKLLFPFKPFVSFASLFTSRNQLLAIKAKMECDLFVRKHVIKDNTQVLILAAGNPKVPVTGESAPFLLANMIMFCETLGIGTTLMDSLKHTINHDKKIRRLLNIPKQIKIFGVLALGYSDERIVNVPKGYNVPVFRNNF